MWCSWRRGHLTYAPPRRPLGRAASGVRAGVWPHAIPDKVACWERRFRRPGRQQRRHRGRVGMHRGDPRQAEESDPAPGVGHVGRGDGSGAICISFSKTRAGGPCATDYVLLDFKGWRYVRMPEWAKGEVFDFAFPYSNYWAIRSIDFGAIARVYVFLTNLAPGAAAKARFSRLEALCESPLAVRNPGLSVNKESITFPVTLEPDSYLECQGGGTVRVFDPNGHTKLTARPDRPLPTLRKGSNQVRFFCDQGEGKGESVKVTLITKGKPLR